MQRWILRVTGFAVDLFYRREFLGQPVPTSGPVLLVGNHPNGLVDPVLLAKTTSRPLRFLGKAPLFEMPVIGWLMRGLGALPVYRAKDGADTAKNTATFEAVWNALAAGDVVCLFPEGVSHSAPELQQLKTGAARMALGAEARADFRLGVRIVPVGLTYRANRRFRSSVAVWVGEAIEARAFRAAHGADEREATRLLTERIADGLRDVTLNLSSWEDLPLLDLAERLWQPAPGRELPRLRAFAGAVRQLRDRASPELDELGGRIATFHARLEHLGLTLENLDVEYRRKAVLRFVLRTAFRFLIGLPLALAGILLWFVPYRLVALATRFAKPSPDTFATVAILSSLLFFPPVWIGTAWALGSFFGWSIGLAAFASAPWLGIFALDFLEWRREVFDDVRTFFLLTRRTELRRHLRAQRDRLAASIERMARAQKPTDSENDSKTS